MRYVLGTSNDVDSTSQQRRSPSELSYDFIIYLLSCTLTMTAVVRDVPCEARFTEAPEATQRVLAVRMRGVT